MVDLVNHFKSVAEPFFIESIEEGTDLESLRYHGRDELIYANGRQVMVRSCHDALVECDTSEGERGLLLIRRNAEPAMGYLWSLGGFFDKGLPTNDSLASRIKSESGLDIDESSYVVLGHARMMWKTTPHPNAAELGLPLGIDDTALLFYVNSPEGELNLDKLHDRPRIITPKMYTPEFRSQLHPYIQHGMDRAISLI